MLPATPEGAGIVLPAAGQQPQQAPASQQAGHEQEGVMQEGGAQPEQPGEADAKVKAQGMSSPVGSPAPSTSTMGAAGAPDEGAAAAAAAAAAAEPAAGGARTEQPPGKVPAAGSSKQGKKKVVRTKDEFTEMWKKFMKSKQLDTSPQQFNRQALDLFKLFRLVLKAGGYQTVLDQKGWARIGRHFNPPPSMTDLSFQIKKAYINKLLALEEAYSAGQLDVEFALEAGGTPEPAAKAPPKRKAAEPAEAPSEQPKVKRERQQPKQQQQQQQQQGRRAKGEGAGMVVPSPQAPQHPPSRPRAKPRTGKKPAAQEAGKGGKGAKAAARSPSTAAGRGSRQDGGGAEARPPSRQRGKRQRVLQRRTEPPEVVASPETMVGRRIGVFWADDEVFYHGTVVGYNSATDKHTVQYDDGDREELVLAYEDWAFLDKHQRAAQAAATVAAAYGSGAGAPQQPGPPAGPGAAQAAAAAAAAGGGHPQMQVAAAPQYYVQRIAGGPGSHEPVLAGRVHYAPQPQMAGVQQQQQQQAQQAQQAQQRQQVQQQQQQQQPLGPLVLPDFAGGEPSNGVPPLFRQPSGDEQLMLVPSLHPHASLPGALPGMLSAEGEPEPTQRHTAAQTLQWVANGRPHTGGAPAPGQLLTGHPAAQQQQWLYQSQQQFAPHGGGYGAPYSGYPASGPLPAAHAASLGLPPLPPRPASGGVGAFPPPPPPSAMHRPAHDLVAQGPNFRAYTTMEPAAGYEVFALVPGLTADEVSVRCWSSGVVLIEGEPASGPSGPGVPPPLSEHVQLPTRIDTRSAVAQLTPAGQLYLRVNAV